MSHPKGGEGASNCVKKALANIFLRAVTIYGKHFYGMGGPTSDIYGMACFQPSAARRCV